MVAWLVSIPERLIRSLAGLVGGLGRLLARLIPGPVRKGRFYKASIERSIKILSDDVGQVGLFAEPALDRRMATRLGLGGTLDNLNIVLFHVSPLWLFLAASDVCAGAREIVRELGRELQEAGVIEAGSSIDSVDVVLSGLSRLSGRVADTLDRPPLSVTEMRETVQAMKAHLQDVSRTATDEAGRIDDLAREIQRLALVEHQGILEITAAVAAGALHTTRKLVTGTAWTTVAGLGVLGRRFYTDVVLDYAAAVTRIHRLGLSRAVASFLRPHTRAWRRVWGFPYLTWTEIGLSLGRWRRAPWRR